MDQFGSVIYGVETTRLFKPMMYAHKSEVNYIEIRAMTATPVLSILFNPLSSEGQFYINLLNMFIDVYRLSWLIPIKMSTNNTNPKSECSVF